MRFWILQRPDYESDYRDSYINGSLEHVLSFPGVECDVCGMSRGGGAYTSPYECPESLRSVMELMKGICIPRAEHLELQKQLFAELGVQGEPFVDIHPGSCFPPAILDIPSRPRADFLWPPFSVLVSERIKRLFVSLCGDEVAFFPVTLRKVGKRGARLPAPIPPSGEPEDILSEVPLLSDKTAIGPYYEMIPRYESECSPEWIESGPCPACLSIRKKNLPKREMYRVGMVDNLWKGHKIFYYKTTLHIYVTDGVKVAVERLGPTNLAFGQS
jgi:hypothetical protein